MDRESCDHRNIKQKKNRENYFLFVDLFYYFFFTKNLKTDCCERHKILNNDQVCQMLVVVISSVCPIITLHDNKSFIQGFKEV